MAFKRPISRNPRFAFTGTLGYFKKNVSRGIVESNAGEKAQATDGKYQEAGAEISSRKEVVTKADIILTVHLPAKEEWEMLSSKILLGYYQPIYQKEIIDDLATKNVVVFSIDMIPRTTRAQSMDVLSSQANISGYKAVLLAANLYPRYFPMFMTGAGSIAPAKVLILGAGVAGLQAIATARRLGAVVEVLDTRPAVKGRGNESWSKIYRSRRGSRCQ